MINVQLSRAHISTKAQQFNCTLIDMVSLNILQYIISIIPLEICKKESQNVTQSERNEFLEPTFFELFLEPFHILPPSFVVIRPVVFQ